MKSAGLIFGTVLVMALTTWSIRAADVPPINLDELTDIEPAPPWLTQPGPPLGAGNSTVRIPSFSPGLGGQAPSISLDSAVPEFEPPHGGGDEYAAPPAGDDLGSGGGGGPGGGGGGDDSGGYYTGHDGGDGFDPCDARNCEMQDGGGNPDVYDRGEDNEVILGMPAYDGQPYYGNNPHVGSNPHNPPPIITVSGNGLGVMNHHRGMIDFFIFVADQLIRPKETMGVGEIRTFDLPQGSTAILIMRVKNQFQHFTVPLGHIYAVEDYGGTLIVMPYS